MHKDDPSPRPAAHAPTGRRGIGFRLVLLLTPLLLLALLEGVLRLAMPGPAPLFRAVEVGDVRGFITNPDVGRRYFPRSMRAIMPQMGFQFFPAEKPPGRLRIFCLGGSTTAGFPYHSHGAFGAFLRLQLGTVLPETSVEVINCGMTALSSHTLGDLLGEILRHEPDLIVVYSGHNEFYGVQGVGSISALGRDAGLARLVRGVRRLRIAELLSLLLPRSVATSPPGARNVMGTMVSETEIPPGSPLRAAAIELFSRNLSSLVARAQEAGVPILLCEVASNLRAQAPFGSAHPPGFEGADACAARIRTGEERLAAGDAPGALDELRRAAALDSTYALARYRCGQALDAAGRFAEARREYEAAREYDTVPFRAPRAINETIRAVGRAGGVPVAPIEGLFTAAARNGLPGEDLFLEHLHPTLGGHALIAAGIARTLQRTGLPAAAAWHWEQDRHWQQYAQLSGITDLDVEIAEQRIHMLTHRWPYRRGEAGEEAPAYASQREERLVELATAVVRKAMPLNEAHLALGAHYRETGRADPALAEMRSAALMFPLDPQAQLETARLLLALGQAEHGRWFLSRALTIDPASEEGRLLLAESFHAEGRLPEAARVIEALLREHPDSARGRALRARLEGESRASAPTGARPDSPPPGAPSPDAARPGDGR